MNNNIKSTIMVIAASSFLTACAATPPKIAHNKTHTVEGQQLDIGGRYLPDENQLSIIINNDPVMNGSFPPFTPTQNLAATYNGLELSAFCYFGSILGESGGAVGLISSIIQSKNNASGDKCEVSYKEEVIDTLYF